MRADVKADKLKAPERAAVAGAVASALARHPAAYPELVMTSSETGEGIATLRAAIAGLAG